MKMKKLLTAVTLLSMLFILAACGKSDSDRIIGKWQSERTDTSGDETLVYEGNMVMWIRDGGIGTNIYTSNAGGEEQLYFDYKLEGNKISINATNGLQTEYTFRFDGDDILYLEEPAMNAVEKFIRVE